MSELNSAKISISRRLWVTLGIVVLIRLIYFFPIPGINVVAVFEFYQKHIQGHGGGWLDMVELLHVGKLRNISLFSQGIMPFINACIVIQIVGFLAPGINKIFFYSDNGRKIMKFASIFVALILTTIYANFVSLDLELLNGFPGVQLLYFKGLPLRLSVMISMSVAVTILILLSELIDKFGLGNGVGVIFVSEVLIRIVFALDQVFLFYARNLITLGQLVLFFVITGSFIYFAGFITKFTKKLNLSTHGNEKLFISVKPYWIGVWPLIIAELIFSFIEISLSWISLIIVFLTVVFFSLLYTKVVYQPRRVYELILAYKCKACEMKAKKIEDCLNSAVLKCVSLSIVLFLCIYYLPVILPFLLKISFVSAGIFGAFGIIVVVGMYYDIIGQKEFFTKLQKLSVKDWALLNVANDTTEAQIKKACLKTHGVEVQIKASHFNWGLPIRTAATGYLLYVPALDKEKASVFLNQLQNE